MPIFEYVCGRCGAEVSLLVRSHEAAPRRCGCCKGGRLKRVISRVNVVGKPADASALRSTSREWLERPERFGQAMRAFQERTGTQLSGERIDDAMHRLSEAKKASF